MNWNWLKTCVFPKYIKVAFEIERTVPITLNCPLCESSPEWPFPKERRNRFGMHFHLGKTWRPEKNHPDYELHRTLNYHLLSDSKKKV